jgi:ABC-2 type transport system permease protein
MILRLLYTDELAGFSRSKVMIVLWAGLPAVALILRLINPATKGMSTASLVTLVVASIGGTLSAVLLGTTVTSERNRRVYDLFLIRPVARRDLILAKYFAALSCLLAAAVISVLAGVVVDAVSGGFPAAVAGDAVRSLVMSAAGMAVACAVGVLFGVVIDSVAVSAILSVYLGTQIGALVLLPVILVPELPVIPFSLAAGTVISGILLVIAVRVFERKSI